MSPPAPPKRTLRVEAADGDEGYQRALAIRIKVFVDEQKFSMEDELDDKDETSDHFLLIATNEDGTEEDAGTIRWWPKPDVSPPAGKLGRLAVLKPFRGGGSGKMLVLAMGEHVRQRRGKAGVALRGEKSVTLGYVAEGEPFDEDGAPHIKLLKSIELVPETA
ncbi:hypothetical protein JCM10213v2_000276 [Rhodosporidiobolus nylandii]